MDTVGAQSPHREQKSWVWGEGDQVGPGGGAGWAPGPTLRHRVGPMPPRPSCAVTLFPHLAPLP